MKRIIIGFITILVLLTFSGCWNNRDITDLAIVVGVAADKGENGLDELTMQIVKPAELKPSGEGGSSKEKPYANITEYGETVFDTIRNLLAHINKKAYFAQMQMMVISEEAARSGINQYLDFIERDAETRRRSVLLITKGIKAKTMLEGETNLTKIPTTQKVEALEASKSLCKSFKITLFEVLKDISTEGYCIVLPTCYQQKTSEQIKQEEFLLEGSAIIKKDKLVGFLDPIETRSYLFAKNEVKSTIITVPSPVNQKKKVSIEIIRSTGEVKAKMEEGKPKLSIKVKAEGNIGEQQEDVNLAEKKPLSLLEGEVSAEIKTQIEETVRKTQKEYQSDIFGFIKEIYRNDYKEWQKIVHDWSEIYSNTPVNVSVEFNIRRPGLIRQSAAAK